MEFRNLIHDFVINFKFDSCYSFDDFFEKSNEIMPEIEFNNNENLIETLKKYYGVIGKHTASYSICPLYLLFNLIHDPGEFDISILEDTLRHQGDMYAQTYYWIIFMIEILNREEDAISSENTRIPLYLQIYYEIFILEPLLNNYVFNIRPSFRRNTSIGEKYKVNHENYLYQSEKFLHLENLKDKIGKKFVNIVEKHFCRLKDKLLEKCMEEEITPSRALWLSCVPLTYNEIFNVLSNINNKYIRSSLFFVAGFQNMSKISELIRNNIESDAFVLGAYCYKCKENNDNDNFQELSLDGLCIFKSFYFQTNGDMEMIDNIYQKYKNFPTNKMNEEQYNDFTDKVFRTQDDFYSFYPFYVFGQKSGKTIYNWQTGRSCGDEFIKNNFTPIAIEYKKYYKDYNSKLGFYINENEDNEILQRLTYHTSISCKIKSI
jgi:hypothetical protein